MADTAIILPAKKYTNSTAYKLKTPRALIWFCESKNKSAGGILSWHWPTLPTSCPVSTIGAGGLNFRIRNGNGCGPSANSTSINIVNNP